VEGFFGSATAIGRPVAESRDFHRVLELPFRERPDTEALVEKYTALLSKSAPKCECRSKYLRRCPDRLLPTQAWALDEAAKMGGLLGPIGVGEGKTLLDLLTPMVMPNCKVAVLLIQTDLRDQLLNIDWHFYGQHWNLPNLAGGTWMTPGRPWLHVLAYSGLSSAKSTDILERIQPDLIIADEGQNVRNRTASRTKRFLRYFVAHPGTRLCTWSGTLTKKSLKDYAHLSNLALRENSPTPLHWPTVEEWAGAIDPSDFPSPAGVLRTFCADKEPLLGGWQRRLRGSVGVVSSSEGGNCSASINFYERRVELPTSVEKLLGGLRGSWDRPDGEPLTMATDVARCARELASGFYYRWTWPRGEPKEVRERWLAARKEWNRELREKLKHAREHLDSPLLLANAAIRAFNGYVGELPVWHSVSWREWSLVRETARPETEAVWVDNFLVADAADWMRAHPGGV